MGDSYLESGRTSRQRNESDETYNDTVNVSERTDYFQDQTIGSQHPSSDAPPQWKIRLNKKSYTQRDVMDTLELRVELATMIKKLIKHAKKEIFEPIRPDLKRFDPRRGFETLAILIPGLVEFINEESTSVMHTYFAGITRIAMYLIEPKDRTEKLLERLLVIATCFGPDRAFHALRNEDDLFTDFTHTFHDYGMGEFVVSDYYNLPQKQIDEVNGMLSKTRIMYQNFMSPLPEHIPTLQGPHDDSSSSSEASTQRRKESTPRQQIPEKPRVPQPRGSGSITPPGKPILKRKPETEFTTDFIMKSPEKKPALARTTSVSQTYQDQFQKFIEAKAKIEPGFEKHAGAIRKSISQPGFIVSDYGYLRESPLQSNNKADSPDYPEESVWETHGETIDFENSNKILRKRITVPQEKTSVLAETMNAIREFGFDKDPRITGLTLGTAAGCASAISGTLKKHRGRESDAIIERPQPSDRDDTRIGTFNFNIYGRTPAEVLGSKFRDTLFINEGARRATARALYQRVVDDPNCGETARNIALRELEGVDAAQMHVQNQNLAAMQALRILAHPSGDPSQADLIPAPVLGNRSLTSNVIKSLAASLNNERYQMNNASKPIRYFLIPLADIITREELTEHDAYTLMKNTLHSDLWGIVTKAEIDERMPFAQFWVEIQRNSRRSGGLDTYRRKLEDLLKKPPRDLYHVLQEIHNSWMRIHENEAQSEVRKYLIERDTLKDYRKLILAYFQPFFGMIESAYTNNIATEEMKKRTHAQFGAEVFTKSPISCYADAANTVLSDSDALINRYRENPRKERAQFMAIAPEEDSESENEAPSNKKDSYKAPRNKKRKNKKNHPSSNDTDTNIQEGRKKNKEDKENRTTNSQKATIAELSTKLDGIAQQINHTNQPQQSAPQNQGGQGGPPRRCILCNRDRHFADTCWRYSALPISNTMCSTCGGFHSGPCLPYVPKDMKPDKQDQRNQDGFRGQVNNNVYRQNRNDRGSRNGQGRRNDGYQNGNNFNNQRSNGNHQHQEPPKQSFQGLGNGGQQTIAPAAHLSVTEVSHQESR